MTTNIMVHADAESTKARTTELLDLTTNPADRLWRYPICEAVVGLVAKTPITPNQVTIFHTVLGVAAGVVIARNTPQAWFAAGVMFEARAILDCLDGVLARRTKRSSPFGRALDQLGDTIGFLSLMGGALVCLAPDYGWPAAIVAVALTMFISGSCSSAWDLYRRRFASLIEHGYDTTADDYLTLYHQYEERPMVSLFVSKTIGLFALYTLSPQVLPRVRGRIRERDWPRPDEPHAVTDTGLRIRAAAAQNDRTLRVMLSRLGIVAGDNIILMLTVALLLGQYVHAIPVVMAWGIAIWTFTVLTVGRYLYAGERSPSIHPI
jgi:phosphatidylglycerophosphate synthase